MVTRLDPFELPVISGAVTTAKRLPSGASVDGGEKGASLAGRKGPPVWLRNGLPSTHSGSWILAWLPWGNLCCPTATGLRSGGTGKRLIIFEVLV